MTSKPNKKSIISLALCFAIVLTGCSNDQPLPVVSAPIAQVSSSTSSTSSDDSSTSQIEHTNWAYSEVENPDSMNKFNEVMSRVVSNLQANGITVYDDTGEGAKLNIAMTPWVAPEVSTSEPTDSDSSNSEESGNTTSSATSAPSTSGTSSPGATAPEGDPNSEGSALVGTQDVKDAYFVALDALLNPEITGDGKAYNEWYHNFLNIPYPIKDDKDRYPVNPELNSIFGKNVNTEDIMKSLTQGVLDNHQLWMPVPYAWQLFKANNKKDPTKKYRPSDVITYEQDDVAIERLFTFARSFPSDSYVYEALALSDWNVSPQTKASVFVEKFNTKAKEWGFGTATGFKEQKMMKIFLGTGFTATPYYYHTDKCSKEYYKVSREGEITDEIITIVDIAEDITDYYNWSFVRVDTDPVKHIGYVTAPYSMENIANVAINQFMLKIYQAVSKNPDKYPTLTVFLEQYSSDIWDEIETLSTSDNLMAIVHPELAEEGSEDGEGDVESTSGSTSSSTSSSSTSSNTGTSSDTTTSSSEETHEPADTSSDSSGGTSAGGGLVIDWGDGEESKPEITDENRYLIVDGQITSLIDAVENENGTPLAWTAFLGFLDEIVHENEDNVDRYLRFWDEVNEIIEIEGRSFAQIQTDLTLDAAVSESFYGVLFNRGLPATISTHESEKFEYMFQWLIPDGVKYSELKETVINYIIAVGACVDESYDKALDLGLQGMINKMSNKGYVFTIDYLYGCAVLSIMKG